MLADITIEFYSPPGEGEDSMPSTDGETVIAEGIGNRPDWPDEENEWRKEFIRNSTDET